MKSRNLQMVSKKPKQYVLETTTSIVVIGMLKAKRLAVKG